MGWSREQPVLGVHLPDRRLRLGGGRRPGGAGGCAVEAQEIRLVGEHHSLRADVACGGYVFRRCCCRGHHGWPDGHLQ